MGVGTNDVKVRYNLRMSLNCRVFIAASMLVLASVLTAPAQAPPGAPGGQGRGGRGGAGQTVEKIRTLKPNLYMVTGGGANTLIRVTPDGVIVVDTKNPGDENFNRLMEEIDRKSTRLNSSHLVISYAVFCLKKKT